MACRQACPYNTLTGCRVKELDGICPLTNVNAGAKMPLTNSDRIRAMTDEELAEWILAGVSCDPCDYCKHSSVHCISYKCKSDEETILEWLRQPAKED